MYRRFRFPTRAGRIVPVLAAALAAALFAATPVLADNHREPEYDHDLVILEPLEVESLREGCPAELTVRFVVNGDDDRDLASGDVRIELRTADNGWEWRTLASLPVTFSGAEKLRLTRTWPDDFLTAEETALRWTVPGGLTEIHLRAEVIYDQSLGRTDADPADNLAEGIFDVAEGDCEIDPCIFLGKGWLCDPCIADPACFDRQTTLPICDVMPCERWPCLVAGSCDRLPLEVLLSAPEGIIPQLYVDGQPLAAAARLKEPIRVGTETFHYRLSFLARQGMDYRLGIAAGGDRAAGQVRLRGLLRRAERPPVR